MELHLKEYGLLKTCGWQLASHYFTFRKTMHFIFGTLLHTEFQCQSVLKGSGQMWPVAYHDLLSAIWPQEMERQPWLHAYDIYVNVCIQILPRSIENLEKKKHYFSIESKVLAGKNMATPLPFNSRGLSTNSRGHCVSRSFGVQTLKGGIISKKQMWITIINISIH